MEFRQRQTPEGFVFRLRALQQTVRQHVVKAEQRMVIVAKRRFGRAGQRRGVDNQRRLLGAGVNQPVRQHQTSFRVGVHHFHGFAVAVANDIAQTEGVAANHVIRAAEDKLHALVQTARNGERQRAGHQRRAAHIGFHRIHKRGLLNAVTAGVKRNAFADEAGIDRRVRIARRVEIKRQQHRRAFRAAAYGMQPHVVLLAQIFAFGDAVAHALAADIRQQIHGALRQMLRAHLFRRGVDDIPHPVDDFQAVVQLFLLRVVKRRPGDGAFAFRAAIAHP
ncbi:Probable transmembrane protein [Cronobacter sakazakii 701]|nr:Probable transmembrane protein [Cronobacter sakazakii 701]